MRMCMLTLIVTHALFANVHLSVCAVIGQIVADPVAAWNEILLGNYARFLLAYTTFLNF